MHSSTLKYVVLGTLATRAIFASPTPQQVDDTNSIQISSTPPVDPNEDIRAQDANQNLKRGLTVTPITPPTTGEDDSQGAQDLDRRNFLEARKYAYKTNHCGFQHGTWMPLNPVNTQENGFLDGCSAFCSHFDGTLFPSGKSVAALVQSTGSEVLRTTKGSIGHFTGVIYCRNGYACSVVAKTCTEYMQAIGNPGSQCYGSKNKDTNGGRNDRPDSYYDAIPLDGDA